MDITLPAKPSNCHTNQFPLCTVFTSKNGPFDLHSVGRVMESVYGCPETSAKRHTNALCLVICHVIISALERQTDSLLAYKIIMTKQGHLMNGTMDVLSS